MDLSFLRTPLLIYFIIISIVAVVLTAYDKSASWKRARRIPEQTLWTVAFFGGALFMYITMKLLHHKTRHASFMIPLPVFIVLHAAVAWLVYLW
ncbi:MAG: DUF1294 domain-containing protein [Clostridiales bacterium]|nr:DUF1294 domain-containing protein [Clostridiales bacterium]